MSTHPISAGHGYTYLTSATMAQDASVIPADGLGAYYAERGESPGQWLGTGLAALGIAAGAPVSEAQMIALFGEGRHPDSAAIAAGLRADGAGLDVIERATALGAPFELNLANSAYARQVAQLMAEWNREQGQPSCAPVPSPVKARIRTAVGQALFAEQHGREAADARELSGFIAQQSRLGSKAVAGFDLTFSPVKSVSALWALAPAPVAAQIEAAHRAAVEDALAWLERNAAYTRLGRNGVRQVDTRGFVAAAFVHRSSRAGDPDLHTHVAVSNKVQTLDGQWRALDGRVLFKATVAASERYNTRVEAELRERLGVRFVDRERPGRRPVREIAGIDERLLTVWSRRRSDIDARRAALSAAFQDEHGRPPSPVEAIELAQRATLDTRPRKHEPRSEAEQRAHWRSEAAAAGHADIDAMLAGVLTQPSVQRGQIDAESIRAIAQQVVDRIQSDRATWQRWHVIAEAQRALRRQPVAVADLDAVVDAIVTTALDECSVTLARPDAIEAPEALRRMDGTSVYAVAGAQLYTSRAVLAAEQSLLAAAGRVDGRRVSEPALDMALLEAAANGLDLNGDQRTMVAELATSGSRCQLALAPAGTGKTSALRVLARAWIEDGGDVVALAPSAAAARLLGDATGTPAETLAKAVHDLASANGLPIGRRTLIVVDEAGMASTPDLARLVAHALEVGASVRLVGDDRQLAAVGAGGILRDLAETTGAATLETPVRFTDPVEAAAALGIRDGSPAALDFYLDAGRVHVGDDHTALLSAYAAWTADRAAGRDALLLAATREQVTALNVRARADRRAAFGGSDGREVGLGDGSSASAGDLVITRRNDRRLTITATDWVKNGDRWTVAQVLDGGALRVEHLATGRHVVLPPHYVAEHVALGYAMTIHAAQGSTADTCHTVLNGAECREQLYVALSRGRHANHLHVALPGAADEHAPIRRDLVRPPTATDMLVRVLDSEAAQRSATTAQRRLTDPIGQLHNAVLRYVDAVERVPAADGAATQPAPLPWLPPVPACTDEAWRTYLAARVEQITQAADEIERRVYKTVNPGTVLQRSDPTYQANLALWRATHPGEQNAPALTAREAAYRRHLADRMEDVGVASVREPRRRWLALVAAVDPHAIQAPEWPALAASLTYAFDAGLDVDRLLPGVLANQRYGDALATLRKLIEDRHGEQHRPPAVVRTADFGLSYPAPPEISRGIEF